MHEPINNRTYFELKFLERYYNQKFERHRKILEGIEIMIKENKKELEKYNKND